MHDVGALQRLLDEAVVVVLVAGARPRGTPHRDDLADEEPEGQAPLLRQHGAAPGEVERAHRADLPLTEPDGAGVEVEVAGQGGEQRGLAGAVGADERDQLSPADVEVDVVEDGAAAEADGHALGAEPGGAHAQAPEVRRARRISQKKNGPPTRLVSMPIGRSA